MALNLIHDYSSDELSSDESEHGMDVDEDEIDKTVRSVLNSLLRRVVRQYQRRNLWRSFTSDSGSDSDLSSIEYCNEVCEEECDSDSKPPKTKGELDIDDLPPIDKLQISVAVNELTQLGAVSSIVDRLVIVQSFRNIPPLDIDTVLFSKQGTAIGPVFDVIGPVKQPLYVIRFNSSDEIVDLKVEMNYPIYYSENPQRSLTKYVFVDNLIREKGSDASWKYDNEPPPDALDYSDDEVERVECWKRAAKSRKKNLL